MSLSFVVVALELQSQTCQVSLNIIELLELLFDDVLSLFNCEDLESNHSGASVVDICIHLDMLSDLLL